jgi:two-component sensor histidine kinase
MSVKSPHQHRFVRQCQILLEPNAAQVVAMTLHELATNAAEYGALSKAKGQIELKWSHEDGRLHIRWMGREVQKCKNRRALTSAGGSLNK